MATVSANLKYFPLHSLDVVEHLLQERDISHDRLSEHEIAAEILNQWSNYRLWFLWQEESHALMFTCEYETKVPKHHLPRLYHLLGLINERLWLGHFDYVGEEESVAFRYCLPVRAGETLAPEQVQNLIDIALVECERVYPALQSLLWAGKSPAEALEIALLETIGAA